MTTALRDLHPLVDHPVVVGALEVHRVLDQMHAGADIPLPSGEYAAHVASLDRAARRITALKLKLVAAADKAGAPADAGFAGPESWLAKQTRTTRTTAAREVRLAQDLGSGGHDEVVTALDLGLVSSIHADVIVNATRCLPDGVSDAQRQQVEHSLVQKARRFDPDQLRRIARRAIEAVEPAEAVVDAHEDAQLRTEEEAARAASRLTFHDNGDGTTSGHFTIATTSVAHLRKIIEAMTSPRRMRPAHLAETTSATPSGARTNAAATGPAATSAGRFHDWDHRRGLAFTELLEHLPTDHLHDKTAATVVVTIKHEVLLGSLRAAHLDTGQALSAGEARRIACTAGILPAVLGTGSVALDLGRESRLFSQAQRLAKGLEHDTCAAGGCERPYAWCELHHRTPWSRGGRTDLEDAVPLCHWHHQRIHDPGFWHRYLPDGTISFGGRT